MPPNPTTTVNPDRKARRDAIANLTRGQTQFMLGYLAVADPEAFDEALEAATKEARS